MREEIGKTVILDGKHEVELVKVYGLFSTVKNNGAEWDVMTNRLKKKE